MQGGGGGSSNSVFMPLSARNIQDAHFKPLKTIVKCKMEMTSVTSVTFKQCFLFHLILKYMMHFQNNQSTKLTVK